MANRPGLDVLVICFTVFGGKSAQYLARECRPKIS